MSFNAGFSERSPRFQVLWGFVALIALAFTAGCRGAPGFLAQLDDARRLAADVRIEFGKAADASNAAVMADTDEVSVAFARDAELRSRAVETDLATLAPLLKSLGYPKEIEALAQFQRHFADYRKLDRSILELAVENTNLKAQRLSFGPAREAADVFRASLESLMPGVATKDRCRVEGLVGKAVLAVREIQVIQAPHIAEADDAAMTRMETQMAASRATARSTLAELDALVAPNARAPLAAAAAALDRFDAAAAQIVTLSRRNSNVRSLDLALRSKPSLTVACDDALRVLQGALANEGSKATR